MPPVYFKQFPRDRALSPCENSPFMVGLKAPRLRALLFAAFALPLVVGSSPSRADESVLAPPSLALSPAEKLAVFLDKLGVERLWKPRVAIVWDTGEPAGRAANHPDSVTHCSAFVAAASKRLRVELLHPPEHPMKLLANAQYDWLAREDQGRAQGWTALDSPLVAQHRANDGDLVVAVYKSPDKAKPGHIAIVRPSDKSAESIDREGPQIIQAGKTNYVSTSLARGFSQHPGAWSNRAVRFYAHAVSLP